MNFINRWELLTAPGGSYGLMNNYKNLKFPYRFVFPHSWGLGAGIEYVRKRILRKSSPPLRSISQVWKPPSRSKFEKIIPICSGTCRLQKLGTTSDLKVLLALKAPGITQLSSYHNIMSKLFRDGGANLWYKSRSRNRRNEFASVTVWVQMRIDFFVVFTSNMSLLPFPRLFPDFWGFHLSKKFRKTVSDLVPCMPSL